MRVRVEGADSAAMEGLARQLHAVPGERPREPDLVVRWVDELPAAEPEVLAGPDAGARGETFFVRRSPGGPRATMPFGEHLLGTSMDVERGSDPVPLLDSLAHVVALEQGAFPLHGVVVRHQERGIAVTGWSRSGKTAALMGLLASGAIPVATEWAYPQDRRWYGDDTPARLRPHHLEDLPDAIASPPWRTRASLRSFRAAASAAKRLNRAGGTAVARRLESRTYVDVALAERAGHAPLDQLFLLLRTDRAGVCIRPAPVAELAPRLRESLLEDLAPLTAAHRRFRHLCPNTPPGPLDRLPDLIDASLDSLLGAVRGHVIETPYPPDPRELATAILRHGSSTEAASIR